MDKTVKHNDLTCIFTEANHSYKILDTDQTLTSVTQVISRISPPFNAPAMARQMISKKKPQYANLTVEQIIKQWQDKAALASMEGTSAHNYLEVWPETQGFGFRPETMRVLALTKQIDRLYPKLLERFRFVKAEKLVFSAKLGIAGQVDLLLCDPETEELIILDLKTNSKTLSNKDNAYGNLLPPVEHLANCDTVKYGLQLALYEKILESEGYYPEFKGCRKALIHIRPEVGQVVKVGEFVDEVEKMLEENNRGN